MFPSSKTSTHIPTCPPIPNISATLMVQAITTSHCDYYNCLSSRLCFSSCSPSFYPLQNLQSDLFIMYSRSFFLPLKALQRLTTALGIRSRFLTTASKVPCSLALAYVSSRSLLAPSNHTGLLSAVWMCQTHSFLRAFSAHSELSALLPDCLIGSSFLQVRSRLNIISSERMQLSPTIPYPQNMVALHRNVLFYHLHSNLLVTQINLLIYSLSDCLLPLSPERELRERKGLHLAACCDPDAQNGVSHVMGAHHYSLNR